MARRGRRRRQRVAREPVGLAVDGHVLEPAASQVEPGPRVGGAQPRPPREIGHRRGAVSGEVPVRDLGQRLVAPAPTGLRQPGVEEDERVLLALARSEADEALLRQAPQDVDASLAGRRDASALERLIRGRARDRLAAVEPAGEDSPRPRERRVVQPELAEATGGACDDPGREQLDHPSCVGGGDEVQRPSHGPRPHDAALGQRALDVALACAGHAQPHGPERTEVVLSLDCAEPRDERAWCVRLRRDVLGGEPEGGQVRGAHWRGVRIRRGSGAPTG